MVWYHLVAYAFGALLLVNSVPHLGCGLAGRPFQSPFASPPGKGLSSSTVNVLWGWFNLALAYLLLVRVGEFDVRNLAHVGAFALAGVAGSAFTARNFGKLHGGDLPR